MLKNKFNANTSLFMDSKTFSWFLQNLVTYHYFIYFPKIKKLSIFKDCLGIYNFILHCNFSLI